MTLGVSCDEVRGVAKRCCLIRNALGEVKPRRIKKRWQWIFASNGARSTVMRVFAMCGAKLLSRPHFVVRARVRDGDGGGAEAVPFPGRTRQSPCGQQISRSRQRV